MKHFLREAWHFPPYRYRDGRYSWARVFIWKPWKLLRVVTLSLRVSEPRQAFNDLFLRFRLPSTITVPLVRMILSETWRFNSHRTVPQTPDPGAALWNLECYEKFLTEFENPSQRASRNFSFGMFDWVQETWPINDSIRYRTSPVAVLSRAKVVDVNL